MFFAERSPAVLEELLAQPALATFLRTAASALEVRAADGPINTAEFLQQLWIQPEGQAVVKWLKAREPQLSIFLEAIHGIMQPPEQQDGSTNSQCNPTDSSSNLTSDPFAFENILWHVNVGEILQQVRQFQQMFAQAQVPSDFSGISASASTVDLQTAIEQSMSTKDEKSGETAEKGATRGNYNRENETESTAELPAPVTSSNSPYEEEVQLIGSMGFFDLKVIRTALIATGGNVQYAVSRLLE